jgi:hypothetical protein
MPNQSRQTQPYGEEEEPFWRSHDSSYYEEETPHPLIRPPHLYKVDPDWDESHWFAGEHYWLGHRYYRRRFWQSVKALFGFFRKDKQFPDSVVADEVCEALTHEPEVDVDDIEVTVKEGHVTLTGRATDHWMKQQAEDAIYFLPGVTGVTNNIRVKAA